ncbi:MAG TPA: MarR family transcriptional regulator [Acidimicrobiales bacterium]|nr:MarR family transcriptional regulator [Acidimicrobiales bacterium]
MDRQDRGGLADALYGLLSALVRSTPRDMSLTAVATLATLQRTGPRRITELATVEGVAQPSMTSLIANLERDGLVARQSDPNDRRVTLAVITAQGMQYLATRRRMGTQSVQRLLEKLSDGETVALTRAADALIHLRHLDDQERDPAGDHQSRPSAAPEMGEDR